MTQKKRMCVTKFCCHGEDLGNVIHCHRFSHGPKVHPDGIGLMNANSVARLVLQAFERLPAKAKPRIYENGGREWTTLSGIVLTRPTIASTCVSLGTGMRCLPSVKLPLARGTCLHDWHAEIVAVRTFNIFLLLECIRLAQSAQTRSDDSMEDSTWIRHRTTHEVTSEHPQPFALKEDVRIDMYCSEAPCGDASMELAMQAQDDPTPWPDSDKPEGLLNGRGYFSNLGVVRRKPARADAPVTNSKSCSDKLALKQCTSLLSSLTSLLIHPGHAYLASLILPTDQFVSTSIDRCFAASGRLAPLQNNPDLIDSWSGGYRFYPFQVQQTSEDFSFRRPASKSLPKCTGSNITAAWTPNMFEVLISGTKSGCKQFSSRGRSRISRAGIWETCLQLVGIVGISPIRDSLRQGTYADVKATALLKARELVKIEAKSKVFQGWILNSGDDSFSVHNEGLNIGSTSTQ